MHLYNGIWIHEMSDCVIVVYYTKLAIFQLYHGENKL